MHWCASILVVFLVRMWIVTRGNPVQSGGTLAGDFSGRLLVDLSYDYAGDTNVWPTFKKFEITDRFEGTDDLGIWKSAQSFCSPEHAGTHIDAPSHFHAGGWSVDQIPIDNLVAPVVTVDISDKVAAGDADAQLIIDDLLNWEEKHGLIPNGSVVFMYSGWGKNWPNATAYFGGDISNMTAPFENFHFPGIHPEAAMWLIGNRSIVGMGVDSASTDFGNSQNFLTHQILAKNNVYGLENVKGLDQLPASGSTVYIFPMKIRGGTGAPCRIIANLQQTSSVASSQVVSTVFRSLLLLTMTTISLTFRD